MVLLIISVSVLNFSFWLCIVFLIYLKCLSEFSCNFLSFLKIDVFISLLGYLHIFENIIVLWWCHVSLIFHAPLSFALLSSHLKHQLPPSIFTNSLWERNTFHDPCWESRAFSDLLWICLLHISSSSLLFLRLYAFYQSCKVPGWMLTASILFSQNWC